MAEGLELVVNYPMELYNGKWLLYLISATVEKGVTKFGECTTNYTNSLMKGLGNTAANAVSLVRNKRQVTSSFDEI